jgi:23S rRNA-/tRNA-specific pseudouridylate synthase
MSELPPIPPAAPDAVSAAAAGSRGQTHPPLPVLVLDEDFVAVSKPSGLLVHRDDHHPDAPAALQTVRDQLGKHLYPFHRLDRATSGILLFGFSRKAAAALQESLATSRYKRPIAVARWRPAGCSPAATTRSAVTPTTVGVTCSATPPMARAG